MLRITRFIRCALEGRPFESFRGIILIWNLTNRCNLYCRHCYASARSEASGDLSTEEALALIPSLRRAGVRFAVLSGGEPLLREDLPEIAVKLKEEGIRTYLSTNGTLLNRGNVREIAPYFDYVGISVDGTPVIHNAFRGKASSFEGAVKAVEACLSEGVKTGLRFTLTPATLPGLPFVFRLARTLGVSKVYISHLVHAGRGTGLRNLPGREYRSAVEFIVEKALVWAESGVETEIVTGNNDADGVVLYRKFSDRYPERSSEMLSLLKAWGGNQAGVRIVNIDHKGNVKPDPFFPVILGNVKEKPFEEIWNSNGVLSFLRERPRRLVERCSSCPHLEICNGNSRARALIAYGDIRAEDPACYL
ncbi:MAG: radical SAM protein [Aquificota bacterium]|nr:radical SAM protein [Aquificota bacterium]